METIALSLPAVITFGSQCTDWPYCTICHSARVLIVLLHIKAIGWDLSSLGCECLGIIDFLYVINVIGTQFFFCNRLQLKPLHTYINSIFASLIYHKTVAKLSIFSQIIIPMKTEIRADVYGSQVRSVSEVFVSEVRGQRCLVMAWCQNTSSHTELKETLTGEKKENRVLLTC